MRPGRSVGRLTALSYFFIIFFENVLQIQKIVLYLQQQTKQQHLKTQHNENDNNNQNDQD